MSRVVSLDLAHASTGYAVVGFIPTQGGNACQVARCDRYAGDGLVCAQCVEEWEVHLGNVAAMVEDLELAERKQANFAAAGGGGRRAVQKPPIELDADGVARVNLDAVTAWTIRTAPGARQPSYYLDRLRSELVGQVRFICEQGHIVIPDIADNPVAMSWWLLGQTHRLPVMPDQDGAGLVEDLAQMMADCLQVIDAPRRLDYVRECPCGRMVWAPTDKDTTCCPGCGVEYDVAAEHDARIDVARDYLVTAKQAGILAKIKPGRIHNWVHRGQIATHGKLPTSIEYGPGVTVIRDMSVVRFGDVLDMIEADSA